MKREKSGGIIMKHVLKFKHEEKEGFLSVVEKNNHYYAIVEKDTPKVREVAHSNRMLISYELKNPSYQEIIVHVSFDLELTKWVYEKLEEDKNLYFKQLDDHLCVLEIEKENKGKTTSV